MSTLRVYVLLVAIVGIYCVKAEPAWLEGKPMNQWFEINGTSGAAGAVLVWGPLILREDTTELFVAANGGHGDSDDNRVVSIKLTDDKPSWILRAERTPADQVVANVPYYADGKPTSRHGYQHNFWVPAINRIVLAGARFVFGAAWSFPVIDGFNPDTNAWDPQNTWPNMTGYGVVRERNSSIIWGTRWHRLDLEARQITQPITSTVDVLAFWPVAHDTLRHQLFSLQFGDGQGYNGERGVQASRVPLTGNQQFQVTFKSSSALDTFISDAPTYSAMDYDPINDRFLFYCGQGTAAGRIFVITPNNGNEWEMSILPLEEGSAVPPVVHGSGINRRFLYVPGLNVFVMMASNTDNIYAIRVGSFEQIPQSAPVAVTPSMSAPQSSPSSSAPSANTPKALSSKLSKVTNRLVVLTAVWILL